MGEPTLPRRVKTDSELAAMITATLKRHGFRTVRDVFLYRVIDKNSPFSWYVSTINVGQEDDTSVRLTLQEIERALQEQYDLG